MCKRDLSNAILPDDESTSTCKKKSSLDCAHELLTSGKRNLLATAAAVPAAVPAAVFDLAECCET